MLQAGVCLLSRWLVRPSAPLQQQEFPLEAVELVGEALMDPQVHELAQKIRVVRNVAVQTKTPWCRCGCMSVSTRANSTPDRSALSWAVLPNPCAMRNTYANSVAAGS